MSDDRITLHFESMRSFLDECSARVSEQGIFLAAEPVRPVGSKVEFELGLGDDFPLLRGSGEVVWVVETNGDGGAPGMAVRYDSTDQATAVLAGKIAARQRSASGPVFDLVRERATPPEPFATRTLEAPILEEPAPEPVVETTGDETPTTEEASGAETAVVMPPYLEQPAAKPKRSGLWAILALIAVLTGVAYWQRDFLVETFGGVGAPPAAEQAREPLDGAVLEPETTDVVEPVIQTAQEPEIAAPAAAPEAPAEPATPTGPVTRIEEIRWSATDRGTLLELIGNGAFPEIPGPAYAIERLEDPPRLLLKISGVTEPLARPTLAVGSEEVVGVRTALHGSAPDSSLHLVVDLADPTAQMGAAAADGAVLQLSIDSGAVSP